MKCRFCKKKLKNIFVDLGFAPPSNSYLEKKELSKFEIFYPLRVFVCNKCFFVQTEDFTGLVFGSWGTATLRPTCSTTTTDNSGGRNITDQFEPQNARGVVSGINLRIGICLR